MTTTTIARQLLGQIETGVKMSLGFRDGVDLGTGVRFRVGPGSRRLWLVITLNEMDLYDVRLDRLPRGNSTAVTVVDFPSVHVAELNRTLLDVERKGWGE